MISTKRKDGKIEMLEFKQVKANLYTFSVYCGDLPEILWGMVNTDRHDFVSAYIYNGEFRLLVKGAGGRSIKVSRHLFDISPWHGYCYVIDENKLQRAS